MPTSEDPNERVKQLEERCRALEAESNLLAEQNEESHLIGIVSEDLYASNDIDLIIGSALERLSLLEDIPLCVSGVLTASGEFRILQCYASFTHEAPAADTLFFPPPFALAAASGRALAIGDECRALRLERLFTSGVFAPAAVLTIPLRAQSESGRMLLFADTDDSGRLARLGDLLVRIADLIASKEENLHLLGRLQQLNDEMEQKIIAKTAQLAESEQLFRALFEQASDGILFLSTHGAVVSANKSFAHLHGLTTEEILQPGQPERCGGATLTPERLQRIMAGETLSFEVNHIHEQGHVVPVEVTANLIAVGNKQLIIAVHRSITERKQAEESLRIAATAFESQQGMTITNAQRIILRVNHAFTEITGYSAAEAVGQSPRMLSSGRHNAAFYAAMWEAIAREGAWHGEIWNRRKNGEIYPGWLTISAVNDEAGQVSHYVAAFSDISLRKSAEDQIKNLAFYDPLTQLPNRRLLLDRLELALAAGSRHKRKGALLYVDLDNFKTLNDTLGHFQGDLLLQQVAQRLTACIRDGDTVARLGGDEFLVMLEDLSDNALEAATQAELMGEKVLTSLNQIYQLDSLAHHSSPSIGITLIGDRQAENLDEPLKRAELAMYQAKAAGRNSLRFFDPQMQEEVTARAGLEADLREAVQKGQFVLYYQPQVVGEGRLTGAEALVRWQHPRRGLVAPAEFIPLAEDTGLILPLGQWVLETACFQLAQWATQPTTAQLTMAVNVSARQFHQSDFVCQVLAAIEHAGANPKRLKLELTESLLVNDAEDIITKMNALKAKGVGFSLDDFGTGYSSLSYLKRLPLDQLKIDQGFVRNILTDPNDSAIAKMVVALAESLGLSVIAEGVEMEAQKVFLTRQGCHAYQGYFFSRPLPIADFERFVQRS